MPTYEYRCKACGEQVEVFQYFTDDSLTTCESCGGALRKVFGNVGIAFRGSGFYRNDSRSKSAAAGSGNGDRSPSDDAKSDAKSDSKAGTKADGKVDKKADKGQGASKATPAASGSGAPTKPA